MDYVSHHRFVAYGIYDVPVGQRGADSAANMSRAADLLLACWQPLFKTMFAKSGTVSLPSDMRRLHNSEPSAARQYWCHFT